MEPSLISGDRVFVCRALAYFGQYNAGDIVMLKANYDPAKKYIVKRIIGVPGDTLKISGTEVYINEKLLEEPYILRPSSTNGDIEQILGDNQYFLLGDNRESSLDSRSLGIMHKNDIVAKVILRWFPIKNIKTY